MGDKTNIFIEKSKKIHGDRYDYSFVAYIRAHSKVFINCREHGIFNQEPNQHLKGNGCPKCANKYNGIRQALSLDNFIRRANAIHNNKYNYDLVDYKTNKTKVIIVCPKHGKFEQVPSSHLNGHGCRECHFEKSAKDRTNSVSYFIEKSRLSHGNKYDYSEVGLRYSDGRSKVKIICPKHGGFLQIAKTHMIGLGCQKCSNDNKRYTNEIFMEKAKKVHGDKYNYSKVDYKSCLDEITIVCEKHGEFKALPVNHLRGCGHCNKCGQSFPECKWIESFNNDNMISGKAIRINNRLIKPDGYDPTTNTIYEFYGDYWHGNPKIYNKDDINKNANKTFGELYKRTISRERFIKKYGYKVISIWENDYKNEQK
jgi:hypothetical protein